MRKILNIVEKGRWAPMVSTRTRAAFNRGVEPKNIFEAIRFKLKMSQVEYAELLGISFQRVSLYENSRIFPEPKLAKKIQAIVKEKGIEVTLDELYSDLDWETGESIKRRNEW